MERRAIPMEELVSILKLQLTQGGQAYLTVTGKSMHPMLAPLRDRVLLESCEDDLRAGDIILYKRDNGRYVLHRIIRKGDALICCGDNQWRRETVRPDQVIAVVAGFVRKGKYYPITQWTYRIYCLFSVSLFFLRRPYIAVRRFVGYLCRTLLRKQNK